LTENEILGGDFSKVDIRDIEPLTNSKDAGIKYYGYYYKFMYYKAVSNKEEMELAVRNMDGIRSKVSPVIVKGCKID
jgi:hypothetical protein